MKTSIGQYLIDRLLAAGADHMFGVPGDFIISWMSRAEKSRLKLITASDEQGAGFAADAYARRRGFGVVAITYGVGGLKVANSTGQAYAEQSPVLIISGAPGVTESQTHAMIHHKVRSFDSQLKVFQEITCAQAMIDNPTTACQQIDAVIAQILLHKRPGYIELPRDIETVEVEIPDPSAPNPYIPRPNITLPDNLAASVREVEHMLLTAKRPIIALGIQLVRHGLLDKVVKFAETYNIPLVTTLLSKSAIDETHPQFMGVFAGKMSRGEISNYVENSDCLLVLGAYISDMDTGVYSAQVDPTKVVHATDDSLRISRHIYEKVGFKAFVNAVTELTPDTTFEADYPRIAKLPGASAGSDADALTVSTLFARLAPEITAKTVVIADPGDALFGAIDLPIKDGKDFLACGYYASLGFAVPAAIGVATADKSLRPIVLVGDGAFQMTGMELSVAVRYGYDPIVIVLNNDGYLTERLILEGEFNDITPWRYAKLPEVLGSGHGEVVHTNGEFSQALTNAIARRGQFTLIEAKLARMDCSDALRRLGEAMHQLVSS
ncbi:MAG: thiamine pyrophosphate-dependent enzyme [Burkholderiaceae bacterium]|nr:thiamine pyrophosphate-dependent enzyme [Burkholderiaceae bacterium]MCD8515780.1 thiamine pyrophosphate-dependent enzyme [Burkholderiaceae bacterium]MCD8537032.1 thiamine pyrophosphate-dependent enzyme [Burkholderiaceae bacterium]MCD8565472.1 thiamine pyrophosphate-dependent enzyme [Burkholderiaceae bacterium]